MLTQLSSHRATDPGDLVELLAECHARIRHFLALARRAASHQEAPPEQVAQACAEVERYLLEALPLHIADEEQSIQPRLRGRSPAIDQALAEMARQHEQHASRLAALLRATAEVRRAPWAQAARGELATAAIALQAELEPHLHLEESVIFPAIRSLLSHAVQTSIIGELRQRRSSR